MATTLQDVSSKLMKPAKDLAQWNFPLAQVLEDYFTLLEQQSCDLNFGEAALVLQNSANVYVRRVEYLFQETSALSQSINDHEQEENESTQSNQRQRKSKSKIDFNNFELINFNEDINKNCDLKRTKVEKKIKLLSERYPQLENATRNKFSLEIYDTNGEVIGKKYDFRCNQQLSIRKMLVDELTPNDFIEKQINNNIAEILETDLEVVNAFDSCSEYGDTFREADVFSPTQESAYGSMISSLDANTLPNSHDLSEFSHTLNDSMRDPKDSLLSPVDSSIDCDKKLITQREQLLQITTDERDNCQSTNNSIDNITETNLNIDKASRIRDSIETDAGYTSGDPDDIQPQTLSPPKKIRRVTRSSVINELNENTWKPIPFNGIIPDKLPKSRSEFKLPCHISLLKYRSKSRKKKLSENSMKRENLKRYLLNHHNIENKDIECDERKKLLLYSPTKPMSYRMKEEIEELQKIIERCFKSKSEINQCNYDAVENSNMDLLGFKLKLNNYSSDITKNSPTKEKFVEQLNVIINNCESKIALSSPPEASCSYTPPQSPVYSTHFNIQHVDCCDDFIDENEKSHQERIEEKMKRLHQEFDVRNEQHEMTQKWYKTIETLNSIERRSIFHVHQYEKCILDAMKSERNHQMDFNTIAIQQEPHDVARLFVASLHLANTNKVKINVVNSNEMSTVNLTLLNADTNHHT